MHREEVGYSSLLSLYVCACVHMYIHACVCVCAYLHVHLAGCLSACFSVFYHLFRDITHLYVAVMVISFVRYSLHFYKQDILMKSFVQKLWHCFLTATSSGANITKTLCLLSDDTAFTLLKTVSNG